MVAEEWLAGKPLSGCRSQDRNRGEVWSPWNGHQLGIRVAATSSQAPFNRRCRRGTNSNPVEVPISSPKLGKSRRSTRTDPSVISGRPRILSNVSRSRSGRSRSISTAHSGHNRECGSTHAKQPWQRTSTFGIRKTKKTKTTFPRIMEHPTGILKSLNKNGSTPNPAREVQILSTAANRTPQTLNARPGWLDQSYGIIHSS